MPEHDVLRFSGHSYVAYKWRIGGRWHLVERQYQFGQPVHFAHPITIIVAAPSCDGCDIGCPLCMERTADRGRGG